VRRAGQPERNIPGSMARTDSLSQDSPSQDGPSQDSPSQDSPSRMARKGRV